MKRISQYFGALLLVFAAAACNESATDKQLTNDTIAGYADSTGTNIITTENSTPPDTVANAISQKGDTTAKKARQAKISSKNYDVKKSEKMEADAGGIYPYAEVMPAFPGGDRALNKWLEDNIKYPQDAIDNDVEGDVLLSFSVDETGKIYTPKVISTPLGHGLEEEATSLVMKMPKWNPGRIKGKNVKTRFTLPISFQLL